MQPFALTVKLRGETMAAVDTPSTGYCARDIEALVRGQPITQALAIVERSCATAGHTHRTAACQAIERALGVRPSHHAALIRAVFAEIERLLARIWMLGLCARAVGLDVLWRTALEQRETLFAALYEVTGQRSFWGIAVPGGMRLFDPPLNRDTLLAVLARLEPALADWGAKTSPGGVLGRAAVGVGVLSDAQARALRVMGNAARGSGLDDDLRRDAPDDAYAAVPDAWSDERVVPATGDAAARLSVAADDLLTSGRLARGLLEAARDADDAPTVLDIAEVTSRLGGVEGSATREGPHGPVTAMVTPAPDGSIDVLHLRTPVAGVLAALPDVLREQPVSRAPLILASLDLCAECLDL